MGGLIPAVGGVVGAPMVQGGGCETQCSGRSRNFSRTPEATPENVREELREFNEMLANIRQRPRTLDEMLENVEEMPPVSNLQTGTTRIILNTTVTRDGAKVVVQSRRVTETDEESRISEEITESYETAMEEQPTQPSS